MIHNELNNNYLILSQVLSNKCNMQSKNKKTEAAFNLPLQYTFQMLREQQPCNP